MKSRLELTANTPDDLESIAEKILDWSAGEKIFCFYGEMGAGKTTLIKSLCKKLGVEDHTSSPTFALVNEYHTSAGKKIFHFDFYRIKNEQEALQMGVYEYFDSGHFCMIEWPEKIDNLLPDQFVKVEVDITPTASRKIVLTR